MMYRALIVFFTALTLFGQPAQAQPRDPWAPRDVCVFGMPYLGQAVKPQQEGMLTAILQAVYEHEDIHLYHERLPYERALEEIVTGSDKVHVTMGVRGVRKDLPQGKAVIGIYDLAVAYKYKTGFKGMKTLKGRNVAYLHGFGIANFIPVKVKPQLLFDLSSGFHMLDRDQVDYLFGDHSILKDTLLESQLPSGNVVIEHIEEYAVHPIFSKTKMGQKFLEVYDRRMKVLIASGELEEILRAHGVSEAYLQKVLAANAK